MAVASMRELLEAGVHFGHQTRRWNPKMRRYIYAERGGIYIIDLTQTQELLQEAYDFARNVAERNGTVLFVGTKKQAQDAISREAGRSGMPYVNYRWLGGLLTNWRTMSNRIERLHELRRLKSDGQLELLPSKERISMMAELVKLEANLGGVADLRRQPDAAFIVDLRKEALAVKEARRLGMPVIGLVDTNADPDEADYVVPGNDDAIRACDLITRVIADGVIAGKQRVTPQEMAHRGASVRPRPPPRTVSRGRLPRPSRRPPWSRKPRRPRSRPRLLRRPSRRRRRRSRSRRRPSPRRRPRPRPRRRRRARWRRSPRPSSRSSASSPARG